MCKRLGFAILILTSPLPWRSQRVNFAHRRTLHYDPTRCYHNMQYRNSELALSLIILGIFLALRPLHCSLLPPAPGLSPDMSLTFYPTNKMTYYCNCVLVSQKKKKDLGRVFMRRRICLTFGQQNGNPHLLYFSCRQP